MTPTDPPTDVSAADPPPEADAATAEQPSVATPAPPPAPPVVPAAGSQPDGSQPAGGARTWLAGLDPAGWRPTILLAIAIATLVFGTQLLNAAIPAAGSGGGLGTIGEPLDLTDRVRIHPAPGWAVVDRFSDPPGVRLQHGDVAIDVSVTTFPGSPGAFLSAWIEEVLEPDSSTLSITSSDTTVVGGRYSAVVATYIGIFTGVSTSIEGQLTGIVFEDDLAIVFDAWAPEGSLSAVLSEVREIIDTLEVGA